MARNAVCKITRPFFLGRIRKGLARETKHHTLVLEHVQMVYTVYPIFSSVKHKTGKEALGTRVYTMLKVTVQECVCVSKSMYVSSGG